MLGAWRLLDTELVVDILLFSQVDAKKSACRQTSVLPGNRINDPTL
jgi:hypothetical protein